MAENLNYAIAGSKCYGEGGEVIIDLDEDDNPIKKTLSPAEVQANCNKYGRLYDWATAMALPSSCNENSCSSQIQSKHRGICPSGWHLPSQAELEKLYRHADGTSGTESPYISLTAGKHLKAQNGWEPYSGVENLDTYGFSALPGGDGNSNGNFNDGFYDVGTHGFWWSASESEPESYGSSLAYRLAMSYGGDYAGDFYGNKSILQSVRCLQD
jgi:uncharacterized protein (TIGR02145 family)